MKFKSDEDAELEVAARLRRLQLEGDPPPLHVEVRRVLAVCGGRAVGLSGVVYRRSFRRASDLDAGRVAGELLAAARGACASWFQVRAELGPATHVWLTGPLDTGERAVGVAAKVKATLASAAAALEEATAVAAARALSWIGSLAERRARALTNCRALAGSICKCRCGPCRHWRDLAERGEILAEMHAMARPLSDEMATRQRAEGRCR